MASFKNFKLSVAVVSVAAVASAQQPVVPTDLRPATAETQRPGVVVPPTAPSGPLATPERVADYVLGAEDQIIIHAYQVPEVPATAIQIGGDGYISLPLAGRVRAGGLTVSALEQELAKRFGNYVRDPQVTVLISDYRSQPVSVVGAVNAPGVIQLRGKKTLVEVIALAGGLKIDSGNVATITREASKGKIPLPDATDDATGRFSVAHVKLNEVMEARNPKSNIVVEKNDLITVPKAPLLYVVGQVQKPGGYVMSDRDSVTVLQAVALAGGLTPTAQVKGAKILHQSSDGSSRTEVHANVDKILAGKDPDVALHGDDILFVPNSGAKSAGRKALETALNLSGVALWHI